MADESGNELPPEQGEPVQDTTKRLDDFNPPFPKYDSQDGTEQGGRPRGTAQVENGGGTEKGTPSNSGTGGQGSGTEGTGGAPTDGQA